jgi:hypothetical protein
MDMKHITEQFRLPASPVKGCLTRARKVAFRERGRSPYMSFTALRATFSFQFLIYFRMKNTINYFTVSLLLALSFSACSDWLDIKPLDTMVVEDYWTDESDVESVVLACYRSMQEDDFMDRIISGGELRSDNVTQGRETPVETRDIMNATIQPSYGLVKWEAFYRLINYCNTVLAYAPGIIGLDPDYTEGKLHAHEAEALTLRALAYFYLVRLYKDVPYITEPSVDDSKEFRVPQMPGDEILDRSIQDLLLAERYAIKYWSSTSTNKGRITKNAIRALLADIYLWQFKYAECVEQCAKIEENVIDEDEIIDYNLLTGNELMLASNGDQSVGSFFEIFGMGNSQESIFELQFNVAYKSNSRITTLYGDAETMRMGELSATPLGTSIALSNTTEDFGTWGIFLDNNDVRQKDSYRPAADGSYTIFKYVGYRRSENANKSSFYIYVTGSRTPNWIIYRLADVFLMKAEALTELNRLPEAIHYVNRVYMRSNPELRDTLSIDVYGSQENMRTLVIEERQREFLFEGKRWFDLVRMARRDGNTSQMLSKYLLRKYTYNASIISSKLSIMDALYYPVHRDELNANPELTQNPYYLTNMEK